MTVSVLAAGDEALLRAAFTALIDAEDDLRVVGQAADGKQAVELAARLAPDVVLMDVPMPVLDGIEATRLITGTPAARAPRVLILTTFDLDEYVFQALRAGASGFALKKGYRRPWRPAGRGSRRRTGAVPAAAPGRGGAPITQPRAW